MHSQEINEIAAALAKAQGAMSPAGKDAENPFFKSSYATLTSIWDACRKPLTDNDLAVSQITEIGETGLTLVTTLMHSSGQWIKAAMPIVAKDPANPQSLGSALSYARRYALAAIVGVSVTDEDDDGNQAAAKKQNGNNKRAMYIQKIRKLEKDLAAISPQLHTIADQTWLDEADLIELEEYGKELGQKVKEHSKTDDS